MATRALLCALLLTLCLIAPRPAHAGWGEDALNREAGYIVDCSWTERTTNHAPVHPADDAYGCLNDVRIAGDGPDWVRPGEASVAAVGLMAAVRQLRAEGLPTDRYDGALGAFFDTWLLARSQPWDRAGSGGAVERVFYDRSGKWQRSADATAGATGALVIAMWKRAEYLRGTGRTDQSRAWLRRAWPRAQKAGGFLRRSENPTYHLLRGSAHAQNLWLSDSVLGLAALRCLNAWAAALGQKPPPGDAALVKRLTGAILAMKDPRRGNFFKVRRKADGFHPSYADSVDQLCFLPYEAGVLPAGDAFARQISDGWTEGAGGVRMTPVTDDPADWRYYGTHWHAYTAPRPENDYLYPGPGLQLAKVEWRYAHARGDKTLAERARLRFEWADRVDRSGLWLGADGRQEAGVPNGIIDWRDGKDRAHAAPAWTRFVDTSAYFLEATLMVCFGEDTTYVPEGAHGLPAAR